MWGTALQMWGIYTTFRGSRIGRYIRVKISADYDSTLLQIIWKFINNCTYFHHGYVKLTKPGFHFQSLINFKLQYIHIHIIATIYFYNYILILNDYCQMCQLRQCLALQIRKSTHNHSKWYCILCVIMYICNVACNFLLTFRLNVACLVEYLKCSGVSSFVCCGHVQREHP